MGCDTCDKDHFQVEGLLEVSLYNTSMTSMASLLFSEVTMNVSSEIAWGIIRDNSCFLLKKRGEFDQDDAYFVKLSLRLKTFPSSIIP